MEKQTDAVVGNNGVSGWLRWAGAAGVSLLRPA